VDVDAEWLEWLGPAQIEPRGAKHPSGVGVRAVNTKPISDQFLVRVRSCPI